MTHPHVARHLYLIDSAPQPPLLNGVCLGEHIVEGERGGLRATAGVSRSGYPSP